jgi:BMFP domain-containing protein YqiC
LYNTPSIGPTYALTKDIQTFISGLFTLYETIFKYQTDFIHLSALLNKSFANASLDVSKNIKEETLTDFEEMRKLMIEKFEDEFTRLFESKQFAILSNAVSTDSMGIQEQFKKFFQKYLNNLDIPTREEIDDAIKEIHDLKKEIYFLRKEMEKKK